MWRKVGALWKINELILTNHSARFDNLSESHYQNQVGVIFQSKSGLFELIGQFLRDFTTHNDCKSKEA